MIDAKGNGGLIEWMFPHQSHIGAVEGGHHGQIDSLIFEHLLGHIAGIGMRNGIVNMQ